MNLLRLIISSSVIALVSACGGAGGGDTGEATPLNNLAVAAVEPLVGVWNLPGNWSDTASGDAYLVVRTPNTEGVAEAAIYALDDAGLNCFDIDGGTFGELTHSLTNELFLDVPAFSSAVAELQPNGALEISVYTEGAASGTPPERVLIANQLNISENGISLCVN